MCNLFQMKPSRCTLFLSIFISASLHVSGNYVSIIRRNSLYLCDTGIFHCVWVAVCSGYKQKVIRRCFCLSCVMNINAISSVTFQMHDVRTFSVTTGLRARKSMVRIPVKVKAKVTFTLKQPTKSQKGSRGTAVVNFVFCLPCIHV